MWHIIYQSHTLTLWAYMLCLYAYFANDHSMHMSARLNVWPLMTPCIKHIVQVTNPICMEPAPMAERFEA